MTLTASIRDQLIKLEQIQELDVKILQIETRKKEIPLGLRDFEKALLVLEKEIQFKQGSRDEVEKNLRQVQAAVEINQDRMDRASKKLEVVGNTKEFQAATKEMEQLKKLREELDAQRDKMRADVAAIELTIGELDTKKAAIHSDRSTKQAEFSAVEAELSQALQELQATREGHTGGLPKPLLVRYDRVRISRHGLGIVPAVAGRCKGCNLMIPPQTLNKLYRCEEVLDCPSCNRILFLPQTAATDMAVGPTSSRQSV